MFKKYPILIWERMPVCRFLKYLATMKFTVILFTSTFLQANAAGSFAQKVSIHVQDAPVREVLYQLTKQTGYNFIADAVLIEKLKGVTLQAEDEPLKQVLETCFDPSRFELLFDEQETVVIRAKPVSPVPVQDTLIRVSGSVRDSSGVPLPGVSVLLKETSRGVSTDNQGQYTLEEVPEDGILVFSMVGFEPVEVQLRGREVVDVVLQEALSDLGEVVVVGYGTQKRSDLTGSISSVSGEDLQRVAVPRMDQALQGQTGGVQITNTSSQPGGNVSIRIRGQNSISGSNNPLVVIDGIIGGDLLMINPQDIESMEILKDASATAIYGSRGSNGVILVTTKRGKEGKAQININSYYAMQRIRRTLPLLNAAQQRQALEAFPEDIQRQLGIPGILAGVDPSVDTDWQEEVFQNAPQHEHQVSVSGGTENTRYAIMGNFFTQDGVVKNAGFDRGSLRINLDQQIGEKVNIGVNLNLARFKRDNLRLNTDGGSNGAGVTQSAITMSPMVPVYDAEGNYSGPLNPGAQMNNPAALLYERPSTTRRNFLQGALFAEYELTEYLRFRTNFAYTNTDNLSQLYSSKILLEAAGQGQANIDSYTEQDWLTENTLTYNRTFAGVHDLSVMGGFTAQGISRRTSQVTGLGFSTEVNNVNDISQAEIINADSDFWEERLASFLGRVNYSLMDKYLFTVNLRADGSSKFATENKWGFFPSFALGWRVSEENFLQGNATVSELKLRGSWGTVGSQAIGRYQSLASFNVDPNAYSWGDNMDVVGAYAGRVPNPSLRWETTEQANIGIDLGLFGERVNLTADVYRKVTRDLLYGRQLPFYTGYESQTDNIGSIENKGLELGINTVNTNGAFRWTTSANFSLNRNKVRSLGDDTEFFESASATLGWARQEIVIREGNPLGTFHGHVFDGLYQNESELAAVDHPGAVVGGVRFVDVNGDGRISPEDQTIIGDPNPDFIYGMTNNFSWKNFDLSIFIQGVQGNDVLNLTRARLHAPGLNNSLVSSLDFWRGEGTSNTVQAPGETDGGMSSRWIEDGSFLRLKNVMLGYNLPQAALQRIGLQNLRLYVSAVNLLTITDYSGYDPEVNQRGNESLRMGIDQDSFPVFRTFTLGVNIGL